MPREKRVKPLNPTEDFGTLPIVGGRHKRPPGQGKLLDPTEALPGSIKQAVSTTSAIVPRTPPSAAAAQKMFIDYIRLLKDPEIADFPHRALALVFHVTEEYAKDHEEELYVKLQRAVKSMSPAQMMRRLGVDPLGRVVNLSRFVYQDVDPRVAIVALRELAEYDEAKEDGSRETFESWVAATMAGRETVEN